MRKDVKHIEKSGFSIIIHICKYFLKRTYLSLKAFGPEKGPPHKFVFWKNFKSKIN